MNTMCFSTTFFLVVNLFSFSLNHILYYCFFVIAMHIPDVLHSKKVIIFGFLALKDPTA